MDKDFYILLVLVLLQYKVYFRNKLSFFDVFWDIYTSWSRDLITKIPKLFSYLYVINRATGNKEP